MRTGSSFFASRHAGRAAAWAVAAMLLSSSAAFAQVTGNTTTATDAQGQPQTSVTLSANTRSNKKKPKVSKTDRIQHSKDTQAALRREKKFNPLVGKDASLPDKTLYDKSLRELKSGHFDIARLDLQTLLNTYPDSQYQMRAKLAVADSWYREGGSAALAQAEQEYKDFITFFPNVPEAAEAQMRVGDIYFKQMDVPDRDYAKALSAESEYRIMLKQYPDAPKELTQEASQKLREVQEVLASREANIAGFYSTRENWPATIARYQTVIETYPQYSHMDDALIGLGDAYAAEARITRAQQICSKTTVGPCIPEAARVKLITDYDDKAANAYRTVVLQHSAALHVEDAKERLADMNLPIPTPTPEELAASEKLENSRQQYTMSKRLQLLVLHKPDTVTAAQTGAPPLEDPPPVVAPTVVRAMMEEYKTALDPHATRTETVAETPKPAVDAPGEISPAPVTPPATPAADAAPVLSDVPTAGRGTGDGNTNVMTESAPDTPSGARVGNAGASMGVEVLTPTNGTSVPVATPGSTPPATPRYPGTTPLPTPESESTGAPATPAYPNGAPGPVSSRDTPPSTLPAATGAADPNGGLTAVGSRGEAVAPPVEAPAATPDQVNEVQGKGAPTGPVAAAKGKKNPKTEYDKNDESSSTRKKKKGLSKINPF